MLIQHIGHAEFLIETESGLRIATDPYDAGCGYPVRKIPADIALVSHSHHDHNAVENLKRLKQETEAANMSGQLKPKEMTEVSQLIEHFDQDIGSFKRTY